MDSQNQEIIFLYILKLRDGRHYCGITNNLLKRFKQHRDSKKSWASKQGVLYVVFVKTYNSRSLAARAERKIKNFGVTKYLKYIRVSKRNKF